MKTEGICVSIIIFQQQENKYREGSPLFSMHDLIASSMTIDADERSLTPTQRQIMQILKLNKDQLEVHEVVYFLITNTPKYLH